MIKYRGTDADWIYVNGDRTCYVVTIYGNIINVLTGKVLKQSLDSKGYPMVIIHHNKKQKCIRIHRELGIHFVPNPNPDKFNVINHIDGDKTNYDLSNLEWTDSKGNAQHALRTGLTIPLSLEDGGNSKYTNDQIETICKMMESGEYTVNQISTLTGIPSGTIRYVKNGWAWTGISSKYNVDNCKKDVASKPSVPESTIREACELLQEGKTTISDISEMTGISTSMLRGMKNKTRYVNIASEYDFSNYDKNMINRYSDEVRNKVNALVMEGLPNVTIAEKVGLPRCDKTYAFISRQRKKLNNVKR